MAFVHHRWEKNGRLRVNDANPNQFQWTTTTADDENVDLGGGNYAPYTWDGSVVRFGSSEIDISAGGLLKFLGVERINRIDYTLEGDFGSGFVDANMGGVPTVGITENDDHILIDLTFGGCEFRWQDVPGRTAQDGNMPVSFRAQLYITSGNSVTLSQYITSPMAHDVRVRYEQKGMDPFSPTEDSRPITKKRKSGPDPDDDDTTADYTVGVEIGNMFLRWSDPESDLRTVSVTRQGQKRTLQILMGPYTLVANQELVIVPDTYGPTEITVDSDDGHEEMATSTWANTHDSDGFRVGHHTSDGEYWGGMRWTGLPSNIGDATTVDTGTVVDYYVYWCKASSTTLWNWQFGEENNPATFGSSHKPSTITMTTAAVADSFADGSEPTTNTSPELGGGGSPGQEWLDTVTPVSGGALCIFAVDRGTAGNYCQFEDSSTLSGEQHAAKLTLVYSTGGGGGVADGRLFKTIGQGIWRGVGRGM